MAEVAIVADDLTGALDTAGQWARCGLRTYAILGAGPLPDTEAVAIHTGSRAATAEQAYGRARQAAQRLQGRTVYKKVDSTFRGNIGAEVQGLLDGLGLHRALIAPAFPAAGRTLQGGILYVHGVPLHQTEFRIDPQWPARESHVPTLLARQTIRRVGHLPLDIVAQGEEAICGVLQASAAEIVVADAVQMEHLCTLARAAVHMAPPWLCCGSAGLAEPWLHALGWTPAAAAPFCWEPQAGPVVVVAGSRHPAVARQLRKTEENRGLHLIHLALEEGENSAQWSQAQRILAAGCHLALTTTFSVHRPGQEANVAAYLGRATAQVCANTGVLGLILTGGDTAEAVCSAMGMAGLQVVGEVQPGIPAATAVGGQGAGLRLVTKAGGFGDDEALVQSMDFIQGRRGLPELRP